MRIEFWVFTPQKNAFEISEDFFELFYSEKWRHIIVKITLFALMPARYLRADRLQIYL